MNGYSGGTMQGQHYRTLNMLENMIEDKKPLNEILWFLYDIQTQHKDLKELALLRKAQEKSNDIYCKHGFDMSQCKCPKCEAGIY